MGTNMVDFWVQKIQSLCKIAISLDPMTQSVDTDQWATQFVAIEAHIIENEDCLLSCDTGYRITSLNFRGTSPQFSLEFLKFFLFCYGQQSFNSQGIIALLAIIQLFGRDLLNDFVQLKIESELSGNDAMCTVDLGRIFKESLAHCRGLYLIDHPNTVVLRNTTPILPTALATLIQEYADTEDMYYTGKEEFYAIDECGFSVEYEGKIIIMCHSDSKIEKILILGTDPRATNRIFNPIKVL